MNNPINPDELLTDAELAALEAKLSVITDVSRSDSDMAQLSESERTEAQTFDKLVNLANHGIELKPVSFTIPSVSPSRSGRMSTFKKGLVALAGSVAIIFSVILLQPKPSSQPDAPAATPISSSSLSENDASLNYWNDSFEDQLSEFEGEMICLSSNYDNMDFVVDNMYYLEDFSESGEF